MIARNNYADGAVQGAVAYVDEMIGSHSGLEHRALLADVVTAIAEFCEIVALLAQPGCPRSSSNTSPVCVSSTVVAQP